MKELIIIVTFIASTSLHGQIETVVIHWDSDPKNISFSGAHYESSKDSMPYFTKKYIWESKEVSPIVKITPRKVEPVITVNIPISARKIIDSQPKVEYEIAVERNIPYLLIKILPFIKDSQSGSIERICSFDIQISHLQIDASLKSLEVEGWKSKSVLFSGSWYKIAVEETGIHKLTYEQLKEIGLTSPENARLYGSGARINSEQFSKGHTDDLAPIPHYMNTGGDNTFGPGDFILFYAEGPVNWKYSSENQFFHHELHDYSWRGYYFVTDDHGRSTPMQNVELYSGISTHTISSYDLRLYFEEEKYNLINSGKEWYGDNFNINLIAAYPFQFPEYIPGETAKIFVSTAIRSNVTSAFSVQANGVFLGSISAKGTNLSDYTSTYAHEAEELFSVIPQKEILTLSLLYEKPNSNSEGWLNFITVNSRSKLKMTGNQLQFRDSRSIGIGNIGEFRIENSDNNLVIWEVTDPGNPKDVKYRRSGSVAEFKLSIDSIRKFVAFNPAEDFPIPIFFAEDSSSIDNQNLNGLQQPDMIIITPEIFLEQARRLADFRRVNDGIESAIILQQEIFNEFSSGTPDVVAIRNFMKMLYDRSESNGDYCKYLLLFGDGSYDNRNSNVGNTNLILTYQSDNSLSPTRSYVSDDFFGLLDTDESLYSGLLDIGIGRLPVSTVEEAEVVVDKIISYNDPMAKGKWRNEICFIGDDEDGNLHMRQADALASKVEVLHPGFKINKIYLDAYKQVTGATGNQYPDVNRAINDQMDRGALIINYTGHGSPIGLAHEKILTMNDISQWTNRSTLPLIVTATCEFSRYDEYNQKTNLEYTSAGEEVLLSEKGGSIGLFTTTRLVYAGPDFVLNESFYDIVFRRDANLQYYRLGDIIAYSKNNTGVGINVKKGRFFFEFFIPKDINYSIGNGKIIYYSNNSIVDAYGSFDSFIVGGIGKENAVDNNAPEIDIYINDSIFISGGITDKNPELLVFVRDNFGVNTTGNGIGHDITATLDGDRTGAAVLNELYKSNLGSYNSGIIRYPYFELENGRHEITVKVWDIHNNSAESTIEFIVTDSEEMLLENLYNYPNPFHDRTWFNIEHNRPDSHIRISIMIFNLSGELVKIIEQVNYSAGYRIDPIEWNGKSLSGGPLDGGV